MTMDNKLRLERLTELQGILTHHDQLFKDRFCMNVWRNTSDVSSCGTAACALGSACLHKPFRDAGLRLEACTIFNTMSYPIYSGHKSYGAGSAFFGLTRDEAEFLFHPQKYRKSPIESDSIPPSEVAERVAQLITKYKGEN